MIDRPVCYSSARATLERLPLLDVLTSPVPTGVFQSPVDRRDVLCLHLGQPVPVTYRVGRHERGGVRLHGQYCVVPAGASTRWVVSKPARSLLLRLTPSLVRETAEAMGLGSAPRELSPEIHVRDPQVERIGWLMQAEEAEGHPGGRLFADSLASALAARLLALQTRHRLTQPRGRVLAAWRLRRVLDYIEAHLDEDLSLAELAKVAGYSLSHFKPLFARAVGVPAHQFVLGRRVERARARLLEGGSSLTEIALETGFAHSSHMARCLRRVLGVSPRQLTPH
jgi:AraC family transcriptional regulator